MKSDDKSWTGSVSNSETPPPNPNKRAKSRLGKNQKEVEDDDLNTKLSKKELYKWELITNEESYDNNLKRDNKYFPMSDDTPQRYLCDDDPYQ